MKKKMWNMLVLFAVVGLFVVAEPSLAEAKPAKDKSLSGQVAGADGKVDDTDFAVTLGDVTIKLGEDMNLWLASLGEPDTYFHAKSCLYDGEDKIYEYGDMVLYTFPSGKKDILYIAEYNGDEATLSGIKAGSTKEEVIAAYGQGYTEAMGFITYEYEENASISLKIKDNLVTYIELYRE